MADTASARQGDTLDVIARRHYGDESGYVEALLEANPGIANLVVLPIGTVVQLPDVRVEPANDVVTLWA